jgi:GntR family transcriptional regulator
MLIQWDQESPIYIQLYKLIVKQILDGALVEGEALPSVRNVAAEFQLNPITISKAYQLLQDQQFVEKQRGIGLFILPGAKEKILEKERDEFLTHEWPKTISKIERLQLSLEQLLSNYKEMKQ